MQQQAFVVAFVVPVRQPSLRERVDLALAPIVAVGLRWGLSGEQINMSTQGIRDSPIEALLPVLLELEQVEGVRVDVWIKATQEMERIESGWDPALPDQLSFVQLDLELKRKESMFFVLVPRQILITQGCKGLRAQVSATRLL